MNSLGRARCRAALNYPGGQRVSLKQTSSLTAHGGRSSGREMIWAVKGSVLTIDNSGVHVFRRRQTERGSNNQQFRCPCSRRRQADAAVVERYARLAEPSPLSITAHEDVRPTAIG